MNGISKTKLARAIRELSPLSDAARALVDLTNDPDHTGADVVTIVERDASLTIRVLRIANSPVVAPISPVESLDHAIALMGEDVVVTAALAVGANWMKTSLAGYGGNSNIFESGFKTAIAAGLIAKRVGSQNLSSLAYTGGLLQDIGKVVLSGFLEPATVAVLAEVSSGRAEDWLAAERGELGVDHCEVGTMVADHFGLGPGLCSVIAHHHAPGGAPDEHQRLVKIVHVADTIRAMTGGDDSSDSLSYPLDPSVLASLDISHSDFHEIICDTLTESRKLVETVSQI